MGGDDTDPPGFLQKCLQSKCTTILEDDVKTKCDEFCTLVGLLDAIWSSVRGIDAGLLPTDEQKDKLADALNKGKALWL